MAAKRLSILDLRFHLLLWSPHFPEINSIQVVCTFIVTRFLVSVSGFSLEWLVFSLTVTVGERLRFTCGPGNACFALWDRFVFFAVLPWWVSSSSLRVLSFFLRFFIKSGALPTLASATGGCLTYKTLVVKWMRNHSPRTLIIDWQATWDALILQGHHNPFLFFKLWGTLFTSHL